MRRLSVRILSPTACKAALTIAAALVLTSCDSVGDALSDPPESEYTQAEAYGPMETAAAASVEVLPDFPGFERRGWAELPCSHDGADVPGYTNVEIRYEFSVEDSATDQVRRAYVDALRDFWTAQGYEVTDDSETTRDGRVDRELAVHREDGIDLWYSVTGVVILFVQSGCVPISDHGEIEYIAPIGGIEPGGENDLVEEYFPDGVPTDQAAAVDPFANTRTAAFAPFEAPASFNDLL